MVNRNFYSKGTINMINFNKITEFGVEYKDFDELILVKTINYYNDKYNYFGIDSELFKKFHKDIINPKFKKTNKGIYRVFVTTSNGKDVPLHRLICASIESNEVTLLNDDPIDLRLINFWEDTKGKIAHFHEKNQLGRWITPLSHVIKQKIDNENKQNSNTAPLQSMQFDVFTSYVKDIVTVQIGDDHIVFTDLNDKNRKNILRLSTTLISIISSYKEHTTNSI